MANRFLVAGGDGNWNNTNNWAATTGAGSGASFPVAGDVVAFDSNSGNANMTVNVASACASLVMSGTYAGTLTFTSTLTTTSTITFVAACTIAGTGGTLSISGTATYTSGGKTLTCALTIAGNSTYPRADDWTVNGLTTISVSGTPTLNSTNKTLHCVGGLHQGASTNIAGTTKISLEGGTWDNAGTSVIGNNLDLAGNVTVSGSVFWGATASRTLKYVSGTITTTGSTLTLGPSAETLDTHGVTWSSVTFNAATTFTLSSNLEWSGTVTFPSAATIAGAGTLNGTGAVSITSGIGTVTLNNTGGLVTTGTMTLPNSAITFAGSAGFTVGTLTTASLGASRIYTLTFGNTYTVTSSIANVGTTSAIRQAIKSGTPGSKVVLTLSVGGTSDLLYCDPTDVDSSAGTQIFTARGTITTSLNWTATVSGTGGAPVAKAGVVSGSGGYTMSVRSAQSITVLFTTRAFATGVATNADSLPTGTLYVNGTADAATVTVTNITTGVYKAQVTMPTLSVGDLVDLRINATVTSVADNDVIWRGTKDITLDSSGDVTFNNTSIATVTTVTNQLAAAVIATAIWTDTTAGDFTVSSSIGKGLYTSGVVPGGTNGLFIAGTNAATTVTTSFTTTFTGNLTGTVAGMTAAGWATAFTVNTTKVYADAISGSVVHEIGSAASSGGLTASDVWTYGTRVLTAGTNIALAKGSGVTGFTDIAAADVWAVLSRTLTAATNITSDGATIDQTKIANLDVTVGSRLADADVTRTGGKFWALDGNGNALSTASSIAALNNLSAAGVRTAVGLATANLDAQLAALDADVMTRLASTDYSASPAATAIADAILGRNIGGGSNGGRDVTSALRILRNKVHRTNTTGTVYAEDDTTSAWTFSITTDAALVAVTTLDPA